MKKNPCLQNRDYSKLILQAKELSFDTALLKRASKKLFSNHCEEFQCPNQNDACEKCYLHYQHEIEEKLRIA